MVYRHLSLFTGYGGFELGLRLAEIPFRTIGYVEIDDYCQGIIRARIGDGLLDWAPIVRDVRTADFGRLAGMVDLITAGFPCQPHSVAGLRSGESDERNLWPDTLRAVRDSRPRYVLLENAGIHLRRGNKPAYAYTVLAELAALGYDAEWGIVSAEDSGAPHLRERWFCLAYARGAREQQPQGGVGDLRGRLSHGVAENPDVAGQRLREGRCNVWEGQSHVAGRAIADPESFGGHQGSGTQRGCQEQSQLDPGCSQGADAETRADEAGQSRTFATGISVWQSEPDMARLVHGGAHRVDRVRALGNGVVPPVVALFLHHLRSPK